MKLSDKTFERNYINQHLFLFKEYEQVKVKQHQKLNVGEVYWEKRLFLVYLIRQSLEIILIAPKEHY